MKVLENSSLLVVGYSFGDIYANQLIERHKLIHGDKQRVIIVDNYPEYAKEDWSSLYQYFINHASTGFYNFFLRQLEDANPLDAFKHNIKRIDSNVWQATNGRIRLYTGGFKDAVLRHSDEIKNYLR